MRTTRNSVIRRRAECSPKTRKCWIGRKEHGVPGEDDNIQELPLTHYYSITGHAIKLRISHANDWKVPSEDGEETTTDFINKVILDEELDDRWFAYGCGALLASVFVALIFISKREVCIIDKSDNVLAIIRSNAWSRQEEVYNWQDVGLVEIHRATQNRKTDFNIFFNIEPFSSWVPLSQHGTYASEEEAEEICSEIRDFIGLTSWQNLLQLKKLS
ncbi:uncharacterized protein ACA1_175120 [Acanthamoeba castellanii str. Neff]|uniref:Uncharacterized protein n=1 Tax=Acanthamoeba castellanii (strain ATCC 30010 / Neff) TaxID=1257118 RepID=L8HJH1_ACACF|nr:uncharacterized protein ACA1_175120 [Acanthamoeba castellanii str. Neff]ELR24838.1 hypothetical protein ACA1_175120 [Acanthamoeba castellanii str. Neff]